MQDIDYSLLSPEELKRLQEERIWLEAIAGPWGEPQLSPMAFYDPQAKEV